jgi:N6-L-threonylcarbamoyladenine synthase
MKKVNTILAIETSCDETAAAVIFNGKIKSSIIASSANIHAKYGGVVPEVAAREHVTSIIPTVELALEKSKIELSAIDQIAVTQGPGLLTSLLVGIETAKLLGEILNKPVLPINHMEAHIYANFVTPMSSPTRSGILTKDSRLRGNDKVFPAVILIVSGGHTLLVLMKGHSKYQILGETVDDAAGEAFDKTAKLLGLGYPGGPALAKLAVSGNPTRFKFPRPMIASNNLNFSFSGLKTAVLYELKNYKNIDEKLKADFAASIQAAIVEILINKTEKAISQLRPKTIMLGGGVAANQMLREDFNKLAKKYKIASSIPKFEFCTDNAAMIGLAAWYKLKNKKPKNILLFKADPNLELK